MRKKQAYKVIIPIRFSEAHSFEKPNEGAALELMNQAARHVMNDLRPEISLAFGESDEYNFLLRRSCSLYKRRQSKLVTHIVSLFTSAYVFYWPHYFPQKSLQYPPSFDGRLVVYPTEKEVRDYFAWRQVDSEWSCVAMLGEQRRTESPFKSCLNSAHQQSLQHHLLGSSKPWRTERERSA